MGVEIALGADGRGRLARGAEGAGAAATAAGAGLGSWGVRPLGTVGVVEEGRGAPNAEFPKGELGAGANGEAVEGLVAAADKAGDFCSRAWADSSCERSNTVVFSSSSSHASPPMPPPRGCELGELAKVAGVAVVADAAVGGGGGTAALEGGAIGAVFRGGAGGGAELRPA